MSSDAKLRQQFSERLIESIRDKGWKYFGAGTKIAKILDVSPKMGSKYLNGDAMPSGEKMLTLAKHLEVHPHWLQYGDGAKKLYDEGASSTPAPEDIGTLEPWDSTTPLNDEDVELPFFMEVELSAGTGSTEVRENHGPKLRFAKSTLTKAGVNAPNAACVIVKGDSMEPVMPDGTVVGVNTADKIIRDGKFYAFDHDGQLRIKKLKRLPEQGLQVISLNPEYEPESYEKETIESGKIRIIGRVFWYSALI